MNEAQKRIIKRALLDLKNIAGSEVTPSQLAMLALIKTGLTQALEPTKTFIIRLTLGDGSFTAVVVDDYTEREAIEQVKDTLSYNAIEVIGWKNETGGVTLKDDVKP